MKIFPFLLLLILTTACNRKNDDDILAHGSSFRLIRTDYGLTANPASFRSTRYEYDANNLIREVITDNSNGTVDSKQVYRWLNGNILRVEQHLTRSPWSSSSIQTGLPLKMYSYNETLYNADTTIRERRNYIIQPDEKTEYRSSTKFEYNNQKQVTRRNIYTDEGKLASYTVYEYDKRGNVTKETLYSNVSKTTEPNIITTYEYDNAPNPYRTARLNSEISWYMSVNNIVRQKSNNLASGINSDEQWTYEYRADGYPARQIYADGRKEEFIYSN